LCGMQLHVFQDGGPRYAAGMMAEDGGVFVLEYQCHGQHNHACPNCTTAGSCVS